LSVQVLTDIIFSTARACLSKSVGNLSFSLGTRMMESLCASLRVSVKNSYIKLLGMYYSATDGLPLDFGGRTTGTLATTVYGFVKSNVIFTKSERYIRPVFMAVSGWIATSTLSACFALLVPTNPATKMMLRI
jgi:hypothetical protein